MLGGTGLRFWKEGKLLALVHRSDQERSFSYPPTSCSLRSVRSRAQAASAVTGTTTQSLRRRVWHLLQQRPNFSTVCRACPQPIHLEWASGLCSWAWLWSEPCQLSAYMPTLTAAAQNAQQVAWLATDLKSHSLISVTNNKGNSIITTCLN